MSKSFEILGIITKRHTKDIDEGKYASLTRGFQGHIYFDALKVLNENTVYSLNHNYKIDYQEEKIISVKKITALFDIYSYGSPKIQVNAIVGKNGSGKSTLSEILYLMLYNIAIDKGLIRDPDDKLITDYKSLLNAILILKQDEEYIFIDFEVLNFFEWKHSQKQDSKNIRYYKLESQGGHCKFEVDKLIPSDYIVDDLFYMISMNYSMYGLNEKKMGHWIKHIFHKNDMYRTPIVINPYREDGNIDVNTEDTQNTARAISNLSQRNSDLNLTTLSPDYKFHQLNVIYQRHNRKTAYLTDQMKEYIEKNLRVQTGPPLNEDNIEFRSNYNPYDFFNPIPEPTNKINSFGPFELKFRNKTPFETNPMEVQKIASILLYNSKDAFKIIHTYFYNISNYNDLNEIIRNLKVDDGSQIIEDLFSYFICKLYRIGINYPEEYGSLLNHNKDGFSKGKEFEKALLHVLTSDSHTCFKLKRVYFFLNFSKGKESINFVFNAENRNENHIAWILEELSDKRPDNLHYRNVLNQTFPVPEYKNQNFYQIDEHFFKKNDLAWRIPPPIFYTNLIVKKTHNDQEEDLNKLSSGETQFIYTLQTILYHIININSNREYKNIVLLLDEIELYHHPEYQRVFLSTLRKQINELRLEIESIQIILLTHSPFILSDIPSSNILRLENGIPSQESFNQTFSANIHDMFLSNFFMSSTIGEIAEEKIKEIIHFHKQVISASNKEQIDNLKNAYLEEKKDNFGMVISLIGDDVIKGILENNLIHIEEKLGVGNFIEAKIKALTAEIKKLSNQTNDAAD
ncbi:MAG: AAA family ATPase [Bacteroidota bacterium]